MAIGPSARLTGCTHTGKLYTHEGPQVIKRKHLAPGFSCLLTVEYSNSNGDQSVRLLFKKNHQQSTFPAVFPGRDQTHR